jgi:hypothetical protein
LTCVTAIAAAWHCKGMTVRHAHVAKQRARGSVPAETNYSATGQPGAGIVLGSARFLPAATLDIACQFVQNSTREARQLHIER